MIPHISLESDPFSGRSVVFEVSVAVGVFKITGQIVLPCYCSEQATRLPHNQSSSVRHTAFLQSLSFEYLVPSLYFEIEPLHMPAVPDSEQERPTLEMQPHQFPHCPTDSLWVVRPDKALEFFDQRLGSADW